MESWAENKENEDSFSSYLRRKSTGAKAVLSERDANTLHYINQELELLGCSPIETEVSVENVSRCVTALSSLVTLVRKQFNERNEEANKAHVAEVTNGRLTRQLEKQGGDLRVLHQKLSTADLKLGRAGQEQVETKRKLGDLQRRLKTAEQNHLLVKTQHQLKQKKSDAEMSRLKKHLAGVLAKKTLPPAAICLNEPLKSRPPSSNFGSVVQACERRVQQVLADNRTLQDQLERISALQPLSSIQGGELSSTWLVAGGLHLKSSSETDLAHISTLSSISPINEMTGLPKELRHLTTSSPNIPATLNQEDSDEFRTPCAGTTTKTPTNPTLSLRATVEAINLVME